MNQELLLAAAQKGDAQALERLLGAQRSRVYRFGMRVCPTTEDAEDAVQETLWAATRGIRQFRGPASSLARWMFTMVRRTCLRMHHLQRRCEQDGVWLRAGVGADDPATVALDLTRALSSLDPADREVLLLRDVLELSGPEAAARLGIHLDALKSRLHRARARLRAQVEAGESSPRV